MESAPESIMYCICSKCNQNKLIEEFNKNAKARNGHRHICKLCEKELGRLYRLAHPKLKKEKSLERRFKPIPDFRICSVCESEKPITDFFRDYHASGSYSYVCKQCQNEKRRKIFIERPWVKHYRWMRTRCLCLSTNGHEYYKNIKPLITIEEVKFLYERDKAAEMKRPSLDRKDSTKDYTLDNCQFIEMIENSRKITNKPIFQLDLKMNLIKEFVSVAEASRELKISTNSISKCANGKIQQVKGFIFKFKGKESAEF